MTHLHRHREAYLNAERGQATEGLYNPRRRPRNASSGRAHCLGLSSKKVDQLVFTPPLPPVAASDQHSQDPRSLSTRDDGAESLFVRLAQPRHTVRLPVQRELAANCSREMSAPVEEGLDGVVIVKRRNKAIRSNSFTT